MRDSVAGFASVADGEDYDLFSVAAVEGDIGALAEFNDPLAELGEQVFDGTADLGVLGEDFDALADGFDGAAGGVRTFGGEEGMETSDVRERWRCPDQLWHSGGAASSPASSLASQRSASAAVTCRPVAW